MNFLNNSSEVTGAGVGAGIGAGIKAGIRSRPRIGLLDGAGEILLELGPSTEPGSLASSSSTGSIGGGFRQGERREWDPPEAISVDDLGLVTKFFFQTGWLTRWVWSF